MKYFIIISLLIISLSNIISAQACCTSGTPLLGSLEMTSAPAGMLQIRFSGNYNYLNDVLTKTDFLENQERERISQTLLLEFNYGFTNKLSFTLLMSYIRQSRTISTLSSLDNSLTASGIGDIVALAKYSLIQFDIFRRQELSFGIGLKLPTGNSSIKVNGILIPADMQPGSGSWDTFFWGYYSKGDIFFNNLTLLSSLSYRLNGSNNRFVTSSIGYSFGNEFIGSLGFNFSMSSFVDFTLLSKFRNTKKDSFGKSEIPNTGGNWLYVIPRFIFYLTPKLSSSFDAEIPIYRRVIGTQLTTTYTASISIFYSINLKERNFK